MVGHTQSAKKRLEEEERDLLSKHVSLGDAFSPFDRHVKYTFSLLHDLPSYYVNYILRGEASDHWFDIS